QQACASGAAVTASLAAKGTSFGSITVSCSGTVDTSAIEGLDKDLIVKGFQWKGSKKFIRDFVRGAATNEVGMQGVELVGAGVDGDGDGVADELSVGDVTALTLYQASQPRPVTKLELASLGLMDLIDPAHPITFDLTKDTPENVLTKTSCDTCKVLGNRTLHLGAFKKDSLGRAVISLYGDLKRHDMGPGLAEAVDEVGTGASVFLTR